MSRTEREKMLSGELYRAGDSELRVELAATARWLARYNACPVAERREILVERIGSLGKDAQIRPPFYCDYGFNIHLGADAFLNFNCVILDVARITIGDKTQIGPAVQIYAADHPRDPAVRSAGLELGRPVNIGNNVWIGGGAIILPGVTIEDNAVVGAGSVVTKHVPMGAIVKGNPAR